MDMMTFIGFLAITVTGVVALGVILKLLETDHTMRAQQARSAELEPAIKSATALPAFFATVPANGQATAVFGFDDELVAMLEAHVKRERAIAATFVHLPSIDSLYRQAQPSSFVRTH